MYCVMFLAEGRWGEWESWSPCSVTCGEGQRRRIRHCHMPKYDGKNHCIGNRVEVEDCKTYIPCPSKYLLIIHTSAYIRHKNK